MPKIRLGFIGAGNMAEAIARGVLKAGTYQPGEMMAADPTSARRDLFSQQLGVTCIEDSAAVARQASIVLLAVKPQVVETALQQIGAAVQPETLIISIVAAVSTAFIERHMPPGTAVVRVMPNTALLAGAGVSALCPGAACGPEQMVRAQEIFAAAGKTLQVPEAHMNAVTCLSGSGPAYAFFLAEALADAGKKLGLPADQAMFLAREAIIGAGALLQQSTDSADELRRKVTSPGGFTEAAVKHLQAGGFAPLVEAALEAANRRGGALAR